MLGIIGLIFVIVAPIFVYRNAKQNGHNAVLWTLVAFGIGIGLQIIIPFIVGIVLGVIWVNQGFFPAEIQEKLQTPATILGLISLFLSVIGVLLVMRHVNTVRDVKESHPLPPTPPDFNQ